MIHLDHTPVPTDDEIDLFIHEMLTRPPDFHYYGHLDLTVWGFSPFHTHRDADTIQRSNFEVAQREVERVSPDAIVVMRMTHWAVGWTEEVMIDTRNREAVELVWRLAQKEREYPILDEGAWSELEHASREEDYDAWARHSALRNMERDDDFAYLVDQHGEIVLTDAQAKAMREAVISHLGSGDTDGTALAWDVVRHELLDALRRAE